MEPDRFAAPKPEPPLLTPVDPTRAPRALGHPPDRRGHLAAAALLVPVAGTLDADAPAHEPVLAAITIFGSGRLGPTASAALGLVGAVLGGLALARSRRGTPAGTGGATTIERRGATAALVLGAVSVVLGALFLVTADGGPGTGNGVVGSLVALVVGPVAIVLGGLARSRARRDGSIARLQHAPGGSERS